MKTLEVELNPFSQREGKEPERERKVEFEIDALVEETFVKYQKDLVGQDKVPNFDKLDQMEVDLLNPSQIGLLASKIEKLEAKGWGVYGGLYLSKLIQESYNKGNNNFVINTGDSQIWNIGNMLKGVDDNPIILTINGNVGYSCGWKVENANIKVNGNAESSCGITTKKSIFTIQGDVENGCGLGSKNSTFNIQGNAGNMLGLGSESSKYFIGGSFVSIEPTSEWKPAKNCIYQTSNPATYKKLKEQVKNGSKAELI